MKPCDLKKVKNKWETKSLACIRLDRVIQPFVRLWDPSEPWWEPLFTNGDKVQRWKPLLTKKNTIVHLTFANKHLEYPHDFSENVLWTDERKAECLENVSLITSDVNLTTFYANHSNMVVVAWWAGAALSLITQLLGGNYLFHMGQLFSPFCIYSGYL